MVEICIVIGEEVLQYTVVFSFFANRLRNAVDSSRLKKRKRKKKLTFSWKIPRLDYLSQCHGNNRCLFPGKSLGAVGERK